MYFHWTPVIEKKIVAKTLQGAWMFQYRTSEFYTQNRGGQPKLVCGPHLKKKAKNIDILGRILIKAFWAKTPKILKNNWILKLVWTAGCHPWQRISFFFKKRIFLKILHEWYTSKEKKHSYFPLFLSWNIKWRKLKGENGFRKRNGHVQTHFTF